MRERTERVVLAGGCSWIMQQLLRQCDGVISTRVPGLYFCGLHWMHTQGSGLFYGVGDDAEYVVDHLIDHREPGLC